MVLSSFHKPPNPPNFWKVKANLEESSYKTETIEVFVVNSFYVGALSIVYVGCGPLPGTIWILLFLEAYLPTTIHTQSIRNCWMIKQKISGKKPIEIRKPRGFLMGRSCVSNWFVKFSPTLLVSYPTSRQIIQVFGGCDVLNTLKTYKTHHEPQTRGLTNNRGHYMTTTQTTHSQIQEIHQNWHTSALFDPPRMGKFYDPWTTQIPMMYYFILGKTTCIDSTVIS